MIKCARWKETAEKIEIEKELTNKLIRKDISPELIETDRLAFLSS